VNAFVALLPSQLTELRRLHLSPDYHKDNEFLHLLLRAAICPHDRSAKLSMFLHLEHICVSSAAGGKQLGKSYNHKSDIHYLLHLPTVRAGCGASSRKDGQGFSVFVVSQQATHDVESYYVGSTYVQNLDVAVLPVIFAAMPNLRTLHYEFSGVFDTNFVAHNPTTDIREDNFDRIQLRDGPERTLGGKRS
jgi:hypothetical protein